MNSYQLCVFLMLACSACPAISAEPDSNTIKLRLARSTDGEKFEIEGKTQIENATSPTLAVLPSGTIVAIYDLLDRESVGSRPMAIFSSTEGITWSQPQAIHFENAKDLRGIRRGALLEEDDGVRLFFACDSGSPRESGTKSSGRSLEIRSALSTNGQRFKVQAGTVARLRNVADLDMAVQRLGSRTHLFVHYVEAASANAESRHKVQTLHFVSRKGSRFLRLQPLKLKSGILFDGSIEPGEGELRALVSTAKGVQSMTSRNGTQWSLERGVHLARGCDPAGVETAHGYLLLFQELPAIENDDGEFWARAWTLLAEDAPEDSVEVPEAGNDASTRSAEFEVDADGDYAFDSELAPPPSYDQTVDYAQWFLLETQDLGQDEAARAYQTFMPPPGDDGQYIGWPEFQSMFHDEDVSGPPKPWAEDEHPDWASSLAKTSVLLEQFRTATESHGSLSQYRRSKSSDDETDAEEGLLFMIELPALGPHRDLAKATMADAWKKRDGNVSSEHFVKAAETVLRGAQHLDKGVTLIESLVAIAERGLVQRSVRAALWEGVLTGDSLGKTMETLRRHDVDNEDLGRTIRFEHAAQMDVLQFLFTPPTPDGKPRLNASRLDKIPDFGSVGDAPWRGQLAAMTAEDADATARALDGYFSEMAELQRIGYPEVRASDLEIAVERYLHVSPFTEMMLPSISRYYQLHARSETWRRAIQLIVALHMFEEREGRWPARLSELPDNLGDTIRIDPFSGEDFVYRVTADGPVVYSVGENGEDDGGIHHERWGDGPAEDSSSHSDDFVFWPPQD